MKQLRNYLDQSDFNQRRFASSVQISEAYLSELIAGEKSPSLEVASRIEKATGGAVPMQSWVKGANDNSNAAGEATQV